MRSLTTSAKVPLQSDEVLEGGGRIFGEKRYLGKRRKEINIIFFPWCGVGGVRSCLNSEQLFYEQSVFSLHVPEKRNRFLHSIYGEQWMVWQHLCYPLDAV